jgi:hypothetical protein
MQGDDTRLGRRRVEATVERVEQVPVDRGGGPHQAIRLRQVPGATLVNVHGGLNC